MKINKEQMTMCDKYGAPCHASPVESKVGISLNVKGAKLFPINGMRHPPEGNTTGWYIWAGEEFSDASDFFVPLHVEHLDEWCPMLLKYLALPPGYRFLIGEDDYEDVWFDETLLNI
jgi:hypothetical protein